MQVENTPHRAPELWFEDGNIVIQAENSQFRVHRGILAACSPVFQDMLSFPQPPDSDLVDGCPIVRLPDSAEEVDVFLKALFQPNYFMPFPAKTEYAIIRGCLRLGNKYGVDHLRIRALVHLSSRYRTSLAEWDAVSYESVFRSSGQTPRPLSEIASWPKVTAFADGISLIQLAREVGALWLLPTAFYRLASGWGNNLPEPGRDLLFERIQTNLESPDLVAFVTGYGLQSQAAAADMLLAIFLRPVNVPGCPSTESCTRLRIMAANFSREFLGMCPADPLKIEMWRIMLKEENTRLEFCSVCGAALQEVHKAARQAFWDKLPSMYGLPPWEELEKMKVEAIDTDWVS
ncbi:hypothetical protein FB45DRAFT_851340 [Roridomyces roridus]|uniref:BTB domain-containing protein n=1 Tax=Roridomyces roridus TaxID=1738132 RepID=A0AAD7AY90_9AGAR|nr:hypothetical protein FB45DRAFT_851340 [Roridomyces roridus]